MIRLEGTIFDTCLAKLNVDEAQAAIDMMDTAKLDELLHSKFTDAEMETLTKLAQLSEAIQQINKMKANLQTEKIEQLINFKFADAEISKLEKLAEFIQLHETICKKRKLTVDAEKLAVLDELREQMNIIHQQYQALNDACFLLHTIKTKTEETQKIADELQHAFEELKANSTVRYDKEQNALITKCEHCNEEVLFKLSDLQLVD
jgi:RNase P subunit RPR2